MQHHEPWGKKTFGEHRKWLKDWVEDEPSGLLECEIQLFTQLITEPDETEIEVLCDEEDGKPVKLEVVMPDLFRHTLFINPDDYTLYYYKDGQLELIFYSSTRGLAHMTSAYFPNLNVTYASVNERQLTKILDAKYMSTAEWLYEELTGK